MWAASLMINTKKVEQKLQDLVNQLEGPPFVVATKLYQLGIKGFQGDFYFCPIATYVYNNMKEELGPSDNIYTTADSETIRVRKGRGLFNTAEVTTTSGIAKFIENFDSGEYPELIATITEWVE
jgi:hypothetical protein